MVGVVIFFVLFLITSIVYGPYFYYFLFKKNVCKKKEEKGPSILLNAEEAATKTESVRKKHEKAYLIKIKKEVIEGINKSINQGESRFLLYETEAYYGNAPIQYTHNKKYADEIIKWLVKEYNYTTLDTHDTNLFPHAETRKSHKIYIVWN